jgi:ATP-dependent Lhr-like helicase
VGVLRSARRDDRAGAVAVLSGADPLNLAGIVTPGAKVPALFSNRLLLRDGVPIAALVGGEVHTFEQMTPEAVWDARNVLLRGSPARVPVEAVTERRDAEA